MEVFEWWLGGGGEEGGEGRGGKGGEGGGKGGGGWRLRGGGKSGLSFLFLYEVFSGSLPLRILPSDQPCHLAYFLMQVFICFFFF